MGGCIAYTCLVRAAGPTAGPGFPLQVRSHGWRPREWSPGQPGRLLELEEGALFPAGVPKVAVPQAGQVPLYQAPSPAGGGPAPSGPSPCPPQPTWQAFITPAGITHPSGWSRMHSRPG